MREDWEVRKWNEVLSIVNGKNQKGVENNNGFYPIYGSGGIMGYADNFLCPENTVIIGRKGNINKPIFVKEKFWNVDTAFGLISKSGILDSKFLFYFCVSYNFEKLNKAVTIPSLTKSDLLNIKIDLPPLQTQHQIVEELDSLTSIIEKQKKQLEELDNLAQAIFYDMFGDPIENEKGWDIHIFKEYIDNNLIGIIRSSKEQDINNDYLYFKMNNISVNGSVDLSKITRINATMDEINRYTINDGDFLFNTRNSYELVGKSCIYRSEKKEIALLSNNILKLIFKEGLNNIYLYFIFKTGYIKEQLEKIKKGTTNVAAIYYRDLSNIKLLIPPLTLQQQFASKIEAIEKQKELIKKSIKETEDLFNSRMDYYFN